MRRRREEDVGGDCRREPVLVLAVGEHDALGRRFENLDDLADAQAFGENLRVRERRLVFEMRDSSELIGLATPSPACRRADEITPSRSGIGSP